MNDMPSILAYALTWLLSERRSTQQRRRKVILLIDLGGVAVAPMQTCSAQDSLTELTSMQQHSLR